MEQKLAILPKSPGCYLHKNAAGTVIYVGKAKNLRNRVRSYFRGAHDTKTEKLVSEITDFDYIVTGSNSEALLLEINLIKQYKPRYNILLKDDKSYPYIHITQERHPRLMITRQLKKNDGLYFGPYPNVQAANQTLKLLGRLFPFRKCKQPEGPPCLYYHLGQCLAHGDQLPSPDDYAQMTQSVKRFLQGQDDRIIQDLRAKMAQASQDMAFETAAEIRDLLEAIATLRTKQRVMANDLKDRDVFGYYKDKGWLSIQVFYIRQGKLIERHSQIFPSYEEAESDFITFLGQFYQDNHHLLPKEILLPKEVDEQAASIVAATTIRQPQKGEKKQLVAMAQKNARLALEQQFQLMEKDDAKTSGAITELGELLGIKRPFRIEAFDNSNIQGTNPVSAMVVFEDGRPLKKAYRKYKIKTVEGPDDIATMKEVLLRRYQRVKSGEDIAPDLIVMDGGRAQVQAAKEIVYGRLGLAIPICGLQKNDKHQTDNLLFGDSLQVIPIDRRSVAFMMLVRLQEEVHRFAISFHRQLRSKRSFASRLDKVEGLGPKRKQGLLKRFKTITAMEEATLEELKKAGLPENVAKNVYAFLHSDSTD